MTELHPLVSGFAFNYLEAARQVGEWDRAPALLIILDDGTEDPPFAPVDIPDFVWVDRHPIDVIDFLSHQINAGKIRLIDEHNTRDLEGIAGAILVTEAHTVVQDNPTKSDQETLTAWSRTHRLEEHPQARECRVVTAVDRSLTVAAVQHIRDMEPGTEMIYDVQGTVPEGLRRFTTALCANESARAYYATTDTPSG